MAKQLSDGHEWGDLDETTAATRDLLQALYLDGRSVGGETPGVRLLAPHRYMTRYRRAQGWNVDPRAYQAAYAFRAEIAGQSWTRDEHAAAARFWAKTARDLSAEWDRIVSRARAEYGDYGALISGIYRDHFPVGVQRQLRMRAHGASLARDWSLAHWTHGAGRRVETWRRDVGGAAPATGVNTFARV